MQFTALLNKEVKLLLKNWQLLLVSILVPILTLIVSYITSTTSVIEVEVGYFQCENSAISMLNENVEEISGINLRFTEFNDMNEMKQAYAASNIDAYMITDDDAIELYYDPANTKGQASASLINQATQKINSDHFIAEFPEIVEIIQSSQCISLTLNPITLEEKAPDPLVLFGFIWIFLYSTLNNSVNQIQQEKGTRTLMYIMKSPIKKGYVFLTKQIAVLFQFMLMNSVYLIFVNIVNLYDFNINIKGILAWLIVVFTISSIGHLIGMLINNTGIMLIVELVIVFPVLMVNAIETNVLSNFIALFPTYKATEIMLDSLQGGFGSFADIMICIVTIFACYMINCILLIKKDAVKLCDITS